MLIIEDITFAICFQLWWSCTQWYNWRGLWYFKQLLQKILSLTTKFFFFLSDFRTSCVLENRSANKWLRQTNDNNLTITKHQVKYKTWINWVHMLSALLCLILSWYIWLLDLGWVAQPILVCKLHNHMTLCAKTPSCTVLLLPISCTIQ